jgi:ZIP family zinc transporter
MIEALIWGVLASSALLVGAAAGLGLEVRRQWVGLALAFGAGALIAAVAYELTAEAFETGGWLILAAGMAFGALTYFAGNRWLHRRGAARRGRRVWPATEGQGMSIVLGAALDGIPESIVIGTMLLTAGAPSAAFFAAVILSNVPEGFSAAADLEREGHSPRWIMRLWLIVVLASGWAAMLAYGLLDAASPAIPFVQAFAAGGLITMLVDTMIPEAYHDSGDRAGLVTVLGFALAFLLSAVS